LPASNIPAEISKTRRLFMVFSLVR